MSCARAWVGWSFASSRIILPSPASAGRRHCVPCSAIALCGSRAGAVKCSRDDHQRRRGARAQLEAGTDIGVGDEARNGPRAAGNAGKPKQPRRCGWIGLIAIRSAGQANIRRKPRRPRQRGGPRPRAAAQQAEQHNHRGDRTEQRAEPRGGPPAPSPRCRPAPAPPAMPTGRYRRCLGMARRRDGGST